MAVEISGVTLCESDDLITAACVDYPRTGPIDGCAFEISGWVVSKVPVIAVEFVHEGSVVASCELNHERPDVAEVYGSSSPVGFWKAIGTVGLAPAFAILIRVVFQDGRRGMVAEILGAQQLTSTFNPSMQPIMISSPGRSGSTLLMRMLAEHPDIVVEGRFPYKTHVCSYWMHLVRVLATPMENSPGDAHEFWADPKRIPPFPYFFIDPATGPIPAEQATLDRWYGTFQVEEFARVAQATVESFYQEYAGARGRTTPGFFAEKLVPQCRWTMRLLYPHAREIFLFREPRDTLASLIAFHGRQGVAEGDGIHLVEKDEQLVGLVRESILSLTHLWKSRSQYGAIVRYENLVCSPTEQIRAMLDALQLDSSVNIVKAVANAGKDAIADANSLQKLTDGQSSIGRWKRDLQPRLQKICDEAFEGLLDDLAAAHVK